MSSKLKFLILTFKKMHIYDDCCALNLRLRDYAKNTFQHVFVDLKYGGFYASDFIGR